MTSDRGDSGQDLGGPVALVTDAERMEGATDAGGSGQHLS